MVKSDKTLLFPVILLVYGFISLHARDIEIRVEDADLGIPLEGAFIRSWDEKQYTCDEEGRAVISVPDDRQVVINIAYPGYESERLVIPSRGDRFSLGLHLSDIMEGRELMIEASKSGTSKTKSGRSVAVSDKDISRTAEIGIIEDVMTSIKLLPGVGYTGMFNARPSIRGGEPGDIIAVFDGFYINNPYHWGGMVSIFDPRMVQNAQLDHGVFSARYGHTVSGLLEIRSRKPSSTEAELELGLSSSAANLNLSYPLWGKGGIMLMGKVTYWDSFIWLTKQFVEEVRYVRVAPYIRSGAFFADYRLTTDLELTVNGFIGGDGVGASYNNNDEGDGLKTQTDINFDWDNKLGFFITGLTYNPLPSMVLRVTAGAGFHQADLAGNIYYNVTVPYSKDFIDEFGGDYSWLKKTYSIDQNIHTTLTNRESNYQGREDFDWDIGRGFLFALGVQELTMHGVTEDKIPLLYYNNTFPPFKKLPVYINMPFNQTIDVKNQAFTSSVYTLLEYTTPNKRFGTELGIRLDHIYFIGRDFIIQTIPVLNPRLNLDFGVLQNKRILDSLTATLGTGLFSSMTDNIAAIQSSNSIGDYEMNQNRSWTSVAGTKFNFTRGFSFNIEGCFKYVFDRAYAINIVDINSQLRTTDYLFDGEGRIWDFDLMLQKLESRYWDGWISYSFNYARYRNPQSGGVKNYAYQAGWYYPSFHRFHNLNLVLNIKLVQFFNITIRFGFASGVRKNIVGKITYYPVMVFDEKGTPVLDEQGNPKIIQKYKRESFYSDTERDGFALPLDVKFSFFQFNPNGKARLEFYVAIENALTFLKTRQQNTTFNSYTGKEDQGSDTANYQLPIPMPSIGFKWSY